MSGAHAPDACAAGAATTAPAKANAIAITPHSALLNGLFHGLRYAIDAVIDTPPPWVVTAEHPGARATAVARARNPASRSSGEAVTAACAVTAVGTRVPLGEGRC
ncbi:hypothetical protein GCM10020000_01350 [Streptomyces olivoverticillatus]